MAQFSLRPATFNDLESILDVDLAANPNHQLLSPVPWPPGFEFRPMFLERRQHVVQDPKYGHVVAVDPSGSIVGFIAWTRPVVKTEQQYPEWEPKIPEGTNMEFLLAYMNARNEQKAKYFAEDIYELEALSVHPEYQRKGIGSLLVSHFVSEVDKKPASVYVSSNPESKTLYKIFDFEVLGNHIADLSHVGLEKPIDLYDMLRK